jgi:uncharacterized protein (TIGR00255 family)
MALVSMTGFAFGEASAGVVRLTAELKSYNNRFLDLTVNLPSLLSFWEPYVREALASAVGRGRVEFTLRLKDSLDGAKVEVNQELALQYQKAFETLRRVTGARGGRAKVEHYASFAGVLGSVRETDPSELRSVASGLLTTLLAEFQTARRTEGARLETDLRRQLSAIDAGKRFIEGQSAQLEAAFQANLRRKFAELGAEVDENRLLAETALLLVRYGINEELVRLASHQVSFENFLSESGPVGKKLDFLCQEFGREINTIGSKTTSAEVQLQVVQMKDALENLREQLRNVE